jgi:DUF1009 family protein
MEVPRGGPIAILAGSGHLPLELSDRLRAQSRDHKILAFRGFADAQLKRRADTVVDLLDVKAALAWLERTRPAFVTLAGAVSRPSAGAALNAYAWLRNRQEVADLLSHGDDHVLRAVVEMIEERGHRIVGAHELAPDLLAPSGRIAGPPLREADAEAVAVGLALLDDLSPYDIGQGAVVVGRRILAVEGPEGTDRMIARVTALRCPWPWSRPDREGVLIKLAKRGQDLRVDLPAIGPRTLTRVAKAGLAGVAVGAGCTLVLDRAACAAEADRLGLALVGVARAEPRESSPS